MTFNSISFIIFLPIVFALHWIVPHKFRWALLLVASYYFYMSFDIAYVLILIATTTITFFAGKFIEKAKSKNQKKGILALVIVLCIGTLLFFKYFNFFSESISQVLKLFTIQLSPVVLTLLLPIGISFYIFQTIGYLIDVYRGNIEAEKHIGYYALFVSFFPQISAGPIARANSLLPQIKQERKFDYNLGTYGLKQMAWGYFKKIVLADTLLELSNRVFLAPQGYTGFSLVLAAVFFTIQIYCDFSGYSDIAIGVAKLFGINLMTNFKSPYFSQSIKEFWSRWHISLSTWFRDYLYIPLGGNRVGKIRHAFNLIVTFLASGLWHGANWTFVFWGGIHGVAQVVENSLIPKEKLREKSKGIVWILRVVFVFIFATFAWIFFASNSIGDAFYIIKNLFVGITSPILYLQKGFTGLELDLMDTVYLVISMLILTVFDYFSQKTDIIDKVSSKKLVVRWIIYIAFVLWVLLNIPSSNSTEFIYFKF